MTPQEALADGQLRDALRLQSAVALADPSPRHQLFRSELLILAGELAEAEVSLRAIRTREPGWAASRRGFLQLIQAERRRQGNVRSQHEIVGEVPTHSRCRRRVMGALLDAEPVAAGRWVERADRASPELHGHVDGREFVGLRDLDDVSASVLEAFLGRQYVVIPWERLRQVRLLPAVAILDRGYRLAELQSVSGETWPAVLPVIYPGSIDHGDEYALGLETDCHGGDGGPVLGIGARTLWFGEDEIPLAECRRIDLRPGV